jgi:hypothetical protein
MAISEVCKFEVKEEIDRYVKNDGVSRNEASKKLAVFFTEILGKEIKPETIRQKDYRARQELATNVTTEDWPTCKNGTEGKCGRLAGGNFPVAESPSGKPAKHGLCKHCRKEELGQQRIEKLREEVEAAKKEFETTPVDAVSDKFWNDLADKILDFNVKDGIPCRKVSEEVRAKLEQVKSLLRDYLYDVLETSTCPKMG